MPALADPEFAPVAAESDSEGYARIDENPFRLAAAAPLSTFSIDVDTAAYANVRRFLTSGALPPADAVRIEELLDYFDYDDAPPQNGEPFAVHADVTECPWAPEHRLVRVALKAHEIPASARPRGNLVFLVDVSNSMNQPNKLPLVKSALKLLAKQLREDDRVAILVYASASGVVLPPTTGDRSAEIVVALDRLEAGGSTNGGAGIDSTSASRATANSRA